MATINEQIPTRPMTSRQLTKELRELIDVLSRKLESTRNPVGYARAYRDIFILLVDESVWESIFAISEGNQSNRILHDLGPSRMEWLEEFYENEVKRQA